MSEPFKSGISVPYSPWILLDVSPIGFQSQMFERLVSQVQVSRVGVLMLGMNPLTPQEEVPYV